MSIGSMIMYMLPGVWITFELVPLCIISTFIIGLLLGMLMFKKTIIIKQTLDVYNIIMRGIPALVVLKLLYYNADFGSAFVTAWISLTLYHSAYVGEIIRGCFESVPKGQMMAGQSLGLNYWQIMFKIYLPQNFKQMIPTLCGQYILVVKDTTLVYIVSVQDIMWLGRQLMAQTFNPILGYLLIGAFYYVLCSIIEFIAHRVEKRLDHTNSLNRVGMRSRASI